MSNRDQKIGSAVVHRYLGSFVEPPFAGASFDLGKIQVTGSSGIDALFAREPQMVTPPVRVKVASLQQLAGFERLSVDTLIHKSDRDLWSIRKDADGSLMIERVFDDNGQPLKG